MRREEGKATLATLREAMLPHYLVAALTICTMDHPQQCLSFKVEGGRKMSNLERR